MSKIKNVGLDQYGTEPFEQQQFGAAGTKGVKIKAVYDIVQKQTRRELFTILLLETEKGVSRRQLPVDWHFG